jgi:hypothetical protein
MSVCIEDILVEAAGLGIKLRLDGEKIKAALPKEPGARLQPVLERLRTRRDEVKIVLQRQTQPAMIPRGARLVSWQLKEAPILLERAAVVIDVPKFVLHTLDQLQAALDGRNWLAGNWSQAELIDRLRQMGVVLELDRQ